MQTAPARREAAMNGRAAMGAAALLSLLFLLSVSPAGFADSVTSGAGCENASEPEYDVERHRDNVHDMALGLLDFLVRNARRAAVVSRAGADLSKNRFRNPRKQKFTHTGLVWKSSRDGLWRFKHVLNVCAGPTSELFVQSVVQFFDDEPFRYDIHVAVPSEKLQEGIAAVLEDEAASRRLHNRKYSNIANPFRAEFQNSNGWALAVIAAAQSGLETYPELQANYRKAGYAPSKVKVGFVKKLGAGFVSNATLRDHPPRLFGGWYEFVSSASVHRYLADTDRLVIARELCHPTGCDIPLTTLNGARKPR